MDEKKYIEERLDEQTKWLDKKSIWNQSWYKMLRVTSLCLSALVPVAVIFIDFHTLVKIVIAIAGAATAIITGTIGLFKFQENWIQYRVTCETLKREKYLYLTSSGLYSNNLNSFNLLVERVEEMLLNENYCWVQAHWDDSVNQVNTSLTDISSSTGS